MSTQSEKPQAPLYKRTVETLRNELARGVFPVGSLLPTESALCERFGVSRHTIREALRELKDARLIESRRGSGTIVTHPDEVAQTYVHEAGSLSELNQYAISNWDIRQSRLVALNETLAGRLNDKPGRKWLHMEAFRYLEDINRPVFWTEFYLHPDYASLARMIGKQARPIYELIQDIFGVHITEATQTMRAAVVDPAIAKALRLKKGEMVISVERTYIASSGRLVEWSRNIYPADQFQFSIKLRRTVPAT